MRDNGRAFARSLARFIGAKEIDRRALNGGKAGDILVIFLRGGEIVKRSIEKRLF